MEYTYKCVHISLLPHQENVFYIFFLTKEIEIKLTYILKKANVIFGDSIKYLCMYKNGKILTLAQWTRILDIFPKWI